MVLSQTMAAASGKVRYLKPSALEIPRCCWANKQENTVVPFQRDTFLWCLRRPVLPWWGGSARWGVAEQAGRLALLSHPKLPFPRDLVAFVKQNLCNYGQLRHSKASIPHKIPVVVLAQHWLGAGYLEVGVNSFFLRDLLMDNLGEAAEVCSSSAFTTPCLPSVLLFVCLSSRKHLSEEQEPSAQPWYVCLWCVPKPWGCWFCAWGAAMQH